MQQPPEHRQKIASQRLERPDGTSPRKTEEDDKGEGAPADEEDKKKASALQVVPVVDEKTGIDAEEDKKKEPKKSGLAPNPKRQAGQLHVQLNKV